jgi:queuine tRNA-ribosyltransferase accessory subunit
MTAVGFRVLQVADYAEAVEELEPDVVVGLGDIPYGRALGSKRIEKATDRQIQWMQDHTALRNRKAEASAGSGRSKLFAPLLPVRCANQQFYIDCLADELSTDVSGLAFYSADTLEDVPESLAHLPRLAFITPATPHDVLQQIAHGVDILTIPFITAATDAGIGLAFTFPSPPLSTVPDVPLPLGIDFWLSSHATDLSSITPDCQCYACTNHHRAYIQHLLNAKEMLGWVLLQIHNHHTMDLFFSAVRASIANGTFEEDCKQFARMYESHLPEKTGQGPRVRGYQFKSEGPGEPKKNQAPFTVLKEDGKAKTLNAGQELLTESTPPSVYADAADLEDQGFAEKQQCM